MADEPSGLDRFAEPALLILASLADAPKHGYAMMEDIEEMAGVRLGPGTLYGALARLEESAYIEALPPEGRRHPYRLTDRGAVLLREQLVSMRRFTAMGLMRLGGAA